MPFTAVDAEMKLLKSQGEALRARIDGMATEMDGKSKQLAAIRQEMQLYAESVESLLRRIRQLEQRDVASESALLDKNRRIHELEMLLAAAREKIA